MRLVVIESPFAGAVPRNLAYLRACLADSLGRGEAPYASHGLYTQSGVLDDTIEAERRKGMAAGFAWNTVASLTAVYQDFGMSNGMLAGIADAKLRSRPIEYRRLDKSIVESIRKIDTCGYYATCCVCGKPLEMGPTYCIKCPRPEER